MNCLRIPNNCCLIGDKIYPNRGNVVTQYTAQQLARKQGMERRKSLKFNRLVKRYRIGVEHAIAELKTYKSVASLWRHLTLFAIGHVYICWVCMQKKRKWGLFCKQLLVFSFFRIDKFVPKLRSTNPPASLNFVVRFVW